MMNPMPLKEEPQEVPVLTDISQANTLDAPDDIILDEDERPSGQPVQKEKKDKTHQPSPDTQNTTQTSVQQSLFAPVETPVKPSRPMAKGENPFLPPHIRERLTQNKNTILEELAHVGESLNRHDKRTQEQAAMYSSGSADDGIIDELVAKYLPKIEQELRARLKEQLKK